MYAWRIVFVVCIVASFRLEKGVFSFEDDHYVKRGTPLKRTKEDGRLHRNIQGAPKLHKSDYGKTLMWNKYGIGFKRNGRMRHTQLLLKIKIPRRNLRFFHHRHHHHHHHHYHRRHQHHQHHNKLDIDAGQVQKAYLFNSGHSSRQSEVFKSINSSKIEKKSYTKPFKRKRNRKKWTRIAAKNERKKFKEVQGNSTHTTNKRFMVNSSPGSALIKHKRFHFSHAFVNALKLVLNKRNYFKKDANILDLAQALQSRDSERDVSRNNSITTAVSRGFTQNGRRVRLVKVKEPGYEENRDHHRNGFRLRQPAYRSRILQDAAKHAHSTLVNPTQLGVSILKLLFGNKARLVTKPKYRGLVGGRPDMKYLEGYGTQKQRVELEREIEQENRMIVLKGIQKHKIEETLAKSISDLIKAMNKENIGNQAQKGVSRVHNHDSKLNVTRKLGDVGQKMSAAEDHMGTRKSWVLLKMPKKNEEIVQEEVSHYQESEKDNDKPSKVSVSQVATLGKQNNELSDVKVMHHRKPVVVSSYGDVASDGADTQGQVKKPLVVTTSTDTESRTVPQISYNLNSIKNNRDVEKASGVNPSALALTLGKILKGIQESVKELRNQSKPKKVNLESTAVAKMTSPPIKTSHTSTTSSEASSSQAKSDAIAKIPDLLVAVNKLLGTDSSSSQSQSHQDISGIPSDQPTAVQKTTFNVPTVEKSDATAAARRYVDDERASTNPLQMRPSLGLFDEPITSSVASKKGIDNQASLDNVLFESDELGTQRETQATVDAIKLKEDLESFAEKGLSAHNKYRALHHAQDLKWSDDLATQAEKMAYDMAMKGTIEKSSVASALGYGENVAKITGTTFNKAGEEATNLWYGEEKNYSFSDPRLSPQTDSFTQVIWKGTSKLGMGCARDLQTNDLYVVALYDPKGNDPVGLRSNVLNKGGVIQDVYASIFKRHRVQRNSTPRNKKRK